MSSRIFTSKLRDDEYMMSVYDDNTVTFAKRSKGSTGEWKVSKPLTVEYIPEYVWKLRGSKLYSMHKAYELLNIISKMFDESYAEALPLTMMDSVIGK